MSHLISLQQQEEQRSKNKPTHFWSEILSFFKSFIISFLFFCFLSFPYYDNDKNKINASTANTWMKLMNKLFDKNVKFLIKLKTFFYEIENFFYEIENFFL
jgi:hypothetical protein